MQGHWDVAGGGLCGVLYRTVSGTCTLPEVFTSPTADPAPWYDAAEPGSSDFLGLVLLDLTGYDSTVTRVATNRIQGFGGATFSGMRRKPRVWKFRAAMVSASDAGAEYGLRWLTSVLESSACDSCASCDLTVKLSCPPVTPATNDPNTVLLLHANGTDTSTTFIDSSQYGHVLTAHGDAQIDTSWSKFGGASALFDGSGDYISALDSADWNFGAGDFTIDGWMRFNSVVADERPLCSQWQAGARNFRLGYNPFVGGINFEYSTDGVNQSGTVRKAWVPLTATDYHVAFVRFGNIARCFINGTQIGTDGTIVGTLFDAACPLAIGMVDPPAPAGTQNGWIDELRISKGVARWTSNFTPPTSPYPDPSPCTVDDTIGEWTSYDAVLSEGPHEVEKWSPRTANLEDSMVGCRDLVIVEWVMTAGNPFLYKLPELCLAPVTLGVNTPCTDICDFLFGAPGVHHCCSVTPPASGTLGAIFTFEAGDDTGAIILQAYTQCPATDEFDPLLEMEISGIPAGATLVVDGARHQITLTRAGGDPEDGEFLIDLSEGRTLQWIEARDCDPIGCFCARTAHPCSQGGNTTVQIETQLREG